MAGEHANGQTGCLSLVGVRVRVRFRVRFRVTIRFRFSLSAMEVVFRCFNVNITVRDCANSVRYGGMGTRLFDIFESLARAFI